MALSPVLIAAPQSQPLRLEDVKAHLKVEHAFEDTLIKLYIDAVTQSLDGPEGLLGRALITQTWAYRLDSWSRSIRLPLAPVQSISSITYYDTANASQTFAGASYSLLQDDDASLVHIPYGVSLPGLYGRPDALTVTFVAGYGSAPEDAPAPIRVAMLELIGTMYNNRETVGPSNLAALPHSSREMLDNYRRGWVL